MDIRQHSNSFDRVCLLGRARVDSLLDLATSFTNEGMSVMSDLKTTVMNAARLRLCALRLIAYCVALALVFSMVLPITAVALTAKEPLSSIGETNTEEPGDAESDDAQEKSGPTPPGQDSLSIEGAAGSLPENSVSDALPGEDLNLEKQEAAPSDDGDPVVDINGVNYDVVAHVQDIGWVPIETGRLGESVTVGTTGLSKQIEAIRIGLDLGATNYFGGIAYRAHVQDVGWQDWVSQDEMAGTTGRAKQIEAIQVQLTGDIAELCDVYYRAHIQDYGWLSWAKNGDLSGSSGLSKQIEALQIVVVPSGLEAPGDMTIPYYDQGVIDQQRIASASVLYKTHVQDYGWQGLKTDGEVSGTSGQAKRLEGIEISLGEKILSGASDGVSYCTHVQDYGWQDWVCDGSLSGTTGQAKRLEAIRIKLTGDLANLYDVYYRVHSQNFGWMDWAKNGENAGTAGFSYRLEAIQVLLVKKDAGAPGSTAAPFYEKGQRSGTAAEFVAVALAEPDGRPEGGNANKYTNYRGDAWCAYFVSWCARQAGVGISTIPDIFLCSTLKSFYQTKNQWHGYSYTPKAGDLIFYSTYSGGRPSHVGIVTSCSNGVVCTKEGNVGDGVVGSRTRIAGSSYVAGGWYIVGYASPF